MKEMEKHGKVRKQEQQESWRGLENTSKNNWANIENEVQREGKKKI